MTRGAGRKVQARRRPLPRPRFRHPANRAPETRRERAVEKFVAFFGSLQFIGWMTLLIIAWITVNILLVAWRWDPYPFILLNLLFSTQASYAAPLILLSQNRAAEHDRMVAEHDVTVNENALAEIRSDRELTAEVHRLTCQIHELVTELAARPAGASANTEGG